MRSSMAGAWRKKMDEKQAKIDYDRLTEVEKRVLREWVGFFGRQYLLFKRAMDQGKNLATGSGESSCSESATKKE